MKEYQCAECKALWSVWTNRPYFDEQSVSKSTGFTWGICPECTEKYVELLLSEQPRIANKRGRKLRRRIQKELNTFRWKEYYEANGLRARAIGTTRSWGQLVVKITGEEIPKQQECIMKMQKIMEDVLGD